MAEPRPEIRENRAYCPRHGEELRLTNLHVGMGPVLMCQVDREWWFVDGMHPNDARPSYIFREVLNSGHGGW